MSFLQDLQYKLQDKLGELYGPIAFWGNGSADTFRYNYDFFDQENVLTHLQASKDQPAKICVVAGPINRKQMEKLKEYVTADMFVVHLIGPINPKFVGKNSQMITDIRNHIKVDYEYAKFPIDIPEFIKEVNSVVRGKHD